MKKTSSVGGISWILLNWWKRRMVKLWDSWNERILDTFETEKCVQKWEMRVLSELVMKHCHGWEGKTFYNSKWQHFWLIFVKSHGFDKTYGVFLKYKGACPSIVSTKLNIHSCVINGFFWFSCPTLSFSINHNWNMNKLEVFQIWEILQAWEISGHSDSVPNHLHLFTTCMLKRDILFYKHVYKVMEMITPSCN